MSRLSGMAWLCFCAGLAVPASATEIVVGLGAGGLPQVSIYNYLNPGTPVASFNAFPTAFTGGVRVAVGDVNGDGVADIIAGAGPGGAPQVNTFTRTGGLLGSFLGYSPTFTGGVFVAAGDVNGDGRANPVTGADAGAAPHVKVFDGPAGGELSSFFAFTPSFTGGVRVATGDVNGDGRADIIVGAGPGGGPQVQIYSGLNGSLISSFFAFEPTFTGGIFVATGDVNGDGFADIITGADAGALPHVRVFSGATGALLSSFLAFDMGFQGGVRVAAGDLNGDGFADIITGAGPGGLPHVKVFSGDSGALLSSFVAGPAGFGGGVYVAAIPAPGSAAVLIAGAGMLARRRRR
jgi:hypothetical protein